MPKKKTVPQEDADELFVLEWFANGRNATAAYRSLHPKALATTCATEGWRVLRKPKVQALIAEERKRRRDVLQADADEAMENLTSYARANIQDFFDPTTRKLRNILDVPREIAKAVKALKPTPFGIALVLHDGMKASELLAIDGGRIQQRHKHQHTFDPAKYLGDAPPPGDDE